MMKSNTTPALTWSAYKAANPKTRIRNAAIELGMSELELLSTDIGTSCTRLQPSVMDILSALPSLGTVMALTRCDAAVHEVTLPFSELHLRKKTALFLRPGQDTRFFTTHWKHIFAVDEEHRKSLQFFDTYGEAAHKIFLTKDSHIACYEQLVERFRDKNQSPILGLDKQQSTPKKVSTPIDPLALRQRWSQIKDVHEGGQIIKAFGENKLQVYQALGREYAVKLPHNMIELLLKTLSKRKLPCMIFVQNNSAVQSYAGTVNRMLRTGPWYNILDPNFNLHLNTEQIAQVWLVIKPSINGLIHTLNIFDHKDHEFMIMTDNRRRGEVESRGWIGALQSVRATLHQATP